MRFRTFCNHCIEEKSLITLESPISIAEDDLYTFKCNGGHTNLVELQVFKFELLFDSGLCAMRDKYFMESVLSITAALERFHEFCIKVILKQQLQSEEMIESCFKTMSNQSERQLGAFTALYFSVFKELPKTLNNVSVKFRNMVVHKGYLPSEKESFDYAEGVFDTIKPSYLKLLETHFETILNYQLSIKRERRTKNKDLMQKANVPIVGIAPSLSLTHDISLEDFRLRNFKESYDRIVKSPFFM